MILLHLTVRNMWFRIFIRTVYRYRVSIIIISDRHMEMSHSHTGHTQSTRFAFTHCHSYNVCILHIRDIQLLLRIVIRLCELCTIRQMAAATPIMVTVCRCRSCTSICGITQVPFHNFIKENLLNYYYYYYPNYRCCMANDLMAKRRLS